MKTKTFDTSTLAGLKSAERFKARLENQFDKVTALPVGLFGVRITGSDAKPNRVVISGKFPEVSK